MKNEFVLNKIKSLSAELAGIGVNVFLFGSQARGDSNKNSDWDLLILLDKDTIDESDYKKFFDPYTELSWEVGQSINPQLYTKKDWQRISFTPFYHNVEQDKIALA